MYKMDKNIDFLKKIIFLRNEYMGKIFEFLKKYSSKMENIQFSENIEPFNIVLAVSDIYYRENYHSDIIQYILQNENNAIKYFVNYVNELSDFLNIDINNYFSIEVIREENYIDILIKNLSSNHCIIFENKINNAGDMKRQLPRYYNSVIKKGLIVDGIIYFSLDGLKRPDKSTWTDNDFQLKLENKIVYGAASNDTEYDLVNNFLFKCKNNSEKEQEKAFYSQYIDLLKYLRRNQMDYELMEKFYKEMLNVEQYSSALSIRNMLNDFISFRRDRVYNYFVNNHLPFEKTFKWSNNDTVFEFIRDISPKEHIKIDIFCEQNLSKVNFWIQNPKTKSDLIKTILEKIGEENSFKKEEDNSYLKIFKFPEEDEEMYKYLTKLFSLLDKNKENIIIND